MLDRAFAIDGPIELYPMDECYFCFRTDASVPETLVLTVSFAGEEHEIVATPRAPGS